MLWSDAEAVIGGAKRKAPTLSDDIMKDYFTSLAFERVTSQYCTLQERPSIRLISIKLKRSIRM